MPQAELASRRTAANSVVRGRSSTFGFAPSSLRTDLMREFESTPSHPHKRKGRPRKAAALRGRPFRLWGWLGVDSNSLIKSVRSEEGAKPKVEDLPRTTEFAAVLRDASSACGITGSSGRGGQDTVPLRLSLSKPDDWKGFHAKARKEGKAQRASLPQGPARSGKGNP